MANSFVMQQNTRFPRSIFWVLLGMSLFQKGFTRHIRKFKPDVNKFISVVLQEEVTLAEFHKNLQSQVHCLLSVV